MHDATRRPSRVSLVATVLNEAGSLSALLDSIAAQTRPPDEIVIVDGGSRDGTLERLECWAQGRPDAVVVSAPGTTIAAGRNLAIQRARGDLIAVTDAGVALAPAWLEALISALEEDPSTNVACGFFVPAPQTTFERALGATTLPTIDEIDPARFLPSSRSVAFRRAAWSAVGGYPEWLDYGEDLVFDLALQAAGFRFAWAPRAIVSLRPRPTLEAFFRQYFLYARGDGKADLWPGRHAIRYATYLLGLPLIWRARRNPWTMAAALGAAVLYLRRPVRRLLRMRSSSTNMQPARASRSTPVAELALVPLIRLTGDVAKMLGYPAGIAWRLGHPRAAGR